MSTIMTMIKDNNEYALTVYSAHTSDHSITAYKCSKTRNGAMLYKWLLHFPI